MAPPTTGTTTCTYDNHGILIAIGSLDYLTARLATKAKFSI
jgi:hypothetical protein